MSEMNPVSRFFVNFGTGRRAAQTLRVLEPGLRLPPSSRLLELGAGRGGLSALLQERFKPGRLVVTDFDPRQVEAARAYLTQRFGSVPSALELREVDAKSLPFEDNSFDCVFAIMMLHHVEDQHSEYRERPAVLREIRRVLVRGGAFVYSDFSHIGDLRRTLSELGFACLFEKRRWPHREMAVFRSPM
jgi:arsenite methyltransferase